VAGIDVQAEELPQLLRGLRWPAFAQAHVAAGVDQVVFGEQLAPARRILQHAGQQLHPVIRQLELSWGLLLNEGPELLKCNEPVVEVAPQQGGVWRCSAAHLDESLESLELSQSRLHLSVEVRAKEEEVELALGAIRVAELSPTAPEHERLREYSLEGRLPQILPRRLAH